MKKIENFNAKVNFAFVIRANVFEIEKIKNFFQTLENTTIVFSTISGNRLFITEKKGESQ